MFLKPNEYTLLMVAEGSTRHLGLDDLKRLRDAGVQTTYQLFYWPEWEPTPGNFNWDVIDADLELAQKVGLKTLLIGPCDGPRGYPAEWYSADQSGVPFCDLARGGYTWYSLSPWHQEARQLTLDRIELVMRARACDTVLCARGGQHSGECLLPYVPTEGAFYDPAALLSYQNYAKTYYEGDLAGYWQENSNWTHPYLWQDVRPTAMSWMPGEPPRSRCTVAWLRESLLHTALAEQELYARQGHEIFFMLQHAWDSIWAAGNPFAHALYAAACQMFSNPLTIINYSRFDPHSLAEKILVKLSYDDLKFGDLWVGSEFCEGLLANTATVIQDGLRGTLTAPLSCLTDHAILENWMVDAFAQANAQWCAHAKEVANDPQE